jgi:hypothetical protein
MLVVAVYAQAAVEDQKLFFAFGDSYADTGNSPKSGPNEGTGWLYPYGITWPQYPDGRFSDGKVESDFFGKCPKSSSTATPCKHRSLPGSLICNLPIFPRIKQLHCQIPQMFENN